MVLPFWYRPTQVVPEKGPLNGCVCVCVCYYKYCKMPTGDVFVVELDGEHVASGFLRTNAQRERHVVSLNQLTHGSLADPHALRRQSTCHTQW